MVISHFCTLTLLQTKLTIRIMTFPSQSFLYTIKMRLMSHYSRDSDKKTFEERGVLFFNSPPMLCGLKMQQNFFDIYFCFLNKSVVSNLITSVTTFVKCANGDRVRNCWSKYWQTRAQRPPLGPVKSGRCSEVVSNRGVKLSKYFFDSSNAILGETFTPPPPKKGNQTFVLRRRNLYCIKSKTKSITKKSRKNCQQSHKKSSKKPPPKNCQQSLKKSSKKPHQKNCQQSLKKSSKKPHRKNCQQSLKKLSKKPHRKNCQQSLKKSSKKPQLKKCQQSHKKS
jgi:hypothetical protein